MATTNELLQQLETCAQIIMAPPERVTMNDRNRAQEMFLSFQKTKSPFDLCRQILENCNNQYILFQTGCCLKNGVIREWSELNLEKGQALFNYLFEYVNRRQLEPFVVEELMLVAAVILKRILVNDSQKEIDKNFILLICGLIKNANSTALEIRLNACTAILRIFSEFCTIDQNSDYGLSWYTHLMAKRHFEKYRLKDIFKCAIEVLFEHLKLPESAHRSAEWIKMSTKLIRICESVLCWNFNFHRLNVFSVLFSKSRDDRLESLFFQPTPDWIDFILEGNVISFFFEVYLAFRPLQDENLIHRSLQCLTQLSTTTGPLLYLQREIRKKFSETFMMNIIKLSNLIFDVISPHEVSIISNLINSICNQFRGSSSLQHCDFALLRQFLETMAKLTYKVLLETARIQSAALFDEDNFDKFNQSVEYLLSSWMLVVNQIQFVHHIGNELPMHFVNFAEFIKIEELVNWTKQIFESYIRVHLYEPEGFLPAASKDDDEIQEFEEDDNILFREQLMAIGTMALLDPANSINTVTQLLIMRLNQFETCIMSNENSEDKLNKWTRISEDIHWILMISMYIFCTYTDENDIPSEIIKYSIQSSANVQATQMALQNGDFNTQESIDPVVRFFIVLIKLVNMEKCLLERQMTQWVSPQVSHTLTLFITRFMNIYLNPEESDATDISLSLNTCFGEDSPTAKHLINFFIEHLLVKFVSLNSEAKLLELATEGLKAFCKVKDHVKVLQQCPSFCILLEKFSRNEFVNLSSVVRRNMYYVFVVVFNTSLEKVIDPLVANYQKLCLELQSGNKELVQEHFMQIVECAQGIGNAMTAKTFPILWPKFLLHLYKDLPQVLRLMHNYSVVVQAILELLFSSCVSFVGFFTNADTIAFYNTAVNILSEYASHNKSSYTTDSSRMDELQLEFVWILKFLNEIPTQDMFSVIMNSSQNSSLSSTVNKVLLTSLNIIMPLINHEMLENERLCVLYYKLLEFIAQDSQSFKGFPPNLFESFLKSVEYVFKVNNISNEAKTIGFNIIVELCLHVSSDEEKYQDILKFLKPFFQIIFEFIFSELMHNNTDHFLRDSVAVALYSLICCYKDSYRDIVGQVLHLVGDAQAENTIAVSLFQMAESTELNCFSNQNKFAFKKDFSEFINKLHTMLSL